MIDQTAIDDAIGYMTEMRSICSVPDGNVAKAYDTALACLRECAERRERAADVAPVVHGEWLFVANGEEAPECSVCGWAVLSRDFENRCGLSPCHKYCGHCGARMDGGT